MGSVVVQAADKKRRYHELVAKIIQGTNSSQENFEAEQLAEELGDDLDLE